LDIILDAGSTPAASTIYHEDIMRKLSKIKHKKVRAEDDFKAQLEDAWYLIEKKEKLGNKHLIRPTATIDIEQDEGEEDSNEPNLQH